MLRCLLPVLALVAVAALPAVALAQAETNVYEQKMLGKWEVQDEADLFVFEKNNVCYRMDLDGIKTSENGRWNATAKKLTVEVRYNGKKYRTVFKYEEVNPDKFKLTISRAFVDGKRKKDVKKKELTATRYREKTN
jgi:hypothetical protein